MLPVLEYIQFERNAVFIQGGCEEKCVGAGDLRAFICEPDECEQSVLANESVCIYLFPVLLDKSTRF